ncbi:serine proteinase stubble-like [Bradysia coprophila]|uniref:serine proteinase stubble-like n=1 Tax=Bradysia coprophila TaxID=38358 RepID=UPI00187D73CB|nr:serine proteinase stubble-like [Bradysia coprophila]
MRFIIFILCLLQYQVHGHDWSNRTVRVDLIVNRRAPPNQYDFRLQSPRIVSSGVDATTGQYPWTILIMSRTVELFGITCSGTIISDSYFLSDFGCVDEGWWGSITSIEMYVGSAQWPWPNRGEPTNFVRHYWYIEASPENSPAIVLCRIHEPLTFNPNVQPIRLPYAANANFSYEAWSSIILGYRLAAPDQLQFVPSNLFNNNQCEFEIRFGQDRGIIGDHELCGTINNQVGLGATRHFGIAGGAWMVYEYATDLDLHPVVIGIYQYQISNGTATYGVGTRVSHFLDWIDTLSGGLFK